MTSARPLIALLLLVTWAAPTESTTSCGRRWRRSTFRASPLAIIKETEPARLEGFGTANIEQQIAVTPKTVFKIGSVSKQFIAAGILLLADEGKLSLDDNVREFLDDAPPDWSRVTIGICSVTPEDLFAKVRDSGPSKFCRYLDVIRSAYSAPLEFRPGDKWQYSNIAYFAAGEIIRRVAGKSWAEFIAERIFQPLGHESLARYQSVCDRAEPRRRV